MVKMYSRLGNVASRTLLVAAMTGLLVGCGGSSGDTPLGEQDYDDDGIINSEDPDADGDGILDVDDNFVDLNDDELDDKSLYTAAEAALPLGEQDFDRDGIANDADADADGDGIVDTEDNFVDLDFDDLDDITLLTEAEAEANGTQFVEVSEENVCGSESGLDNASVNENWNDNCVVKRFGQFADSLFTVGIQRVLFCEGYGSGTDYTVFADGEIGLVSDAAIKAFQRDESLVDDGIVGPATWAALQNRIVELDTGIVGQTPDTWGFDTGDCAGIPMFYLETTASDNSEVILGGWTLAKNQPNTDQETPFSWEEPFGRL